jgi:transposase InsO family protein
MRRNWSSTPSSRRSGRRVCEGVTDLSGLVCHDDAGSQYTSIAFTERLAAVGAAPSLGSVGDALDNAPLLVPLQY